MDALIKLLSASSLNSKEILSLEEAAIYMGLSKSHLYKLTSQCIVPFYKPNGKMVYFRRSELEAWILRNRNAPICEVEKEAFSMLANKKPSRK